MDIQPRHDDDDYGEATNNKATTTTNLMHDEIEVDSLFPVDVRITKTAKELTSRLVIRSKHARHAYCMPFSNVLTVL